MCGPEAVTGVIAVIITIMVLELKVPHADGAAGLVAVAIHLEDVDMMGKTVE